MITYTKIIAVDGSYYYSCEQDGQLAGVIMSRDGKHYFVPNVITAFGQHTMLDLAKKIEALNTKVEVQAPTV